MTRTVEEFRYWLKSAEVGERFVYHTGTNLEGARPMARLAWDQAVLGRVTLVQRRVVGTSTFDYIAIRVSGQAGKSLAPIRQLF